MRPILVFAIFMLFSAPSEAALFCSRYLQEQGEGAYLAAYAKLVDIVAREPDHADILKSLSIKPFEVRNAYSPTLIKFREALARLQSKIPQDEASLDRFRNVVKEKLGANEKAREVHRGIHEQTSALARIIPFEQGGATYFFTDTTYGTVILAQSHQEQLFWMKPGDAKPKSLFNPAEVYAKSVDLDDDRRILTAVTSISKYSLSDRQIHIFNLETGEHTLVSISKVKADAVKHAKALEGGAKLLLVSIAGDNYTVEIYDVAKQIFTSLYSGKSPWTPDRAFVDGIGVAKDLSWIELKQKSWAMKKFLIRGQDGLYSEKNGEAFALEKRFGDSVLTAMGDQIRLDDASDKKVLRVLKEPIELAYVNASGTRLLTSRSGPDMTKVYDLFALDIEKKALTAIQTWNSNDLGVALGSRGMPMNFTFSNDDASLLIDLWINNESALAIVPIVNIKKADVQ